MPEHAKRVDFLLLDEPETQLFLQWGPLLVAGGITARGYFAISGFSDLSEREAQIYQLTHALPSFLRALRDAWESVPVDALVSVHRAHE